jgi:hypothetical protein
MILGLVIFFISDFFKLVKKMNEKFQCFFSNIEIELANAPLFPTTDLRFWGSNLGLGGNLLN